MQTVKTKHGAVLIPSSHPFVVESCFSCPFGRGADGRLGDTCRLKEYLDEGSWVCKRDVIPDYCPLALFDEVTVKISERDRVKVLEEMMEGSL